MNALEPITSYGLNAKRFFRIECTVPKIVVSDSLGYLVGRSKKNATNKISMSTVQYLISIATLRTSCFRKCKTVIIFELEKSKPGNVTISSHPCIGCASYLLPLKYFIYFRYGIYKICSVLLQLLFLLVEGNMTKPTLSAFFLVSRSNMEFRVLTICRCIFIHSALKGYEGAL